MKQQKTLSFSSQSPLAVTLIKQILSFAIFLLLAFYSLYFYIDYSDRWVATGIGPIFNDHIYYFEFPLVLIILSLIYFPTIEKLSIRFLLPIIPVLILYSLFDGFYNFLGRSPYPSDFDNFQSVFSFSPLMAIALALMFLTIPAILIVLIYKAYQSSEKNKLKYFKHSLLARIGAATFVFFFLGSETFNQFHQKNFDYVVWSQEDTVRDNGKFSSFIYYNNQEKINKKHLEEITNDFKANNLQADIQKILFPGDIKKPRNIHLVVMESFIDPRQLKDIQYSRSPLADELIPYLNNQQSFSLVTSPIYGGGTAQAEFELLTGTPALSKVNRIEFNVMNGGKTHSFVDKLNQHNYQTIATIATSNGFFNSKQAYKSLGFSKVNYLEDDPFFAEQLKLGPIFDGDVFQENLKQMKILLAQNEQPVFNYILGMFGHLPFRRDQLLRPDIIEVEHTDDRIKKISNQFYYRTKAIAAYLNELMALDPDALILITSDHLPSILNETNIYLLNNKTNIALMFDKNKTIDISGKKLYQLPWLFWDKLSENDQQRIIDDAQLEQLYYQILSESITE